MVRLGSFQFNLCNSRCVKTVLKNLLIILAVVPFILYIYFNDFHPIANDVRQAEPPRPIHLVVVACRDRGGEAIVMLNSSVLFTRSQLLVHIFAETRLHAFFNESLLSWPGHILKRFHYQLYPIEYLRVNQSAWDKPSRECVFQRLFLPELLPTVDSLLYVDTDVVFLSPVDSILRNFDLFNSSQLGAMTRDHHDILNAHYTRASGTPFYGKLGLNSGVILMNLTRMRQVAFVDKAIDYREKYRSKMVLGDQDVLNIYFHFYPEQMYVLDCNWNYRHTHCNHYMNCLEAEQNGAYVVHGCSGTFTRQDQPIFKALYNTMRKYNFEEDMETHLYVSLQNALKATKGNYSLCDQASWVFTRTLRHQLDQVTLYPEVRNTSHGPMLGDQAANRSQQ